MRRIWIAIGGLAMTLSFAHRAIGQERGGAVAASPVRSRFDLTAEEQAKAREMMRKAIAFLRTQQDQKTGGWSVNEKGPTFPAITGLVVSGLLGAGTPESDSSVGMANKFILNYAQQDGGIYDKGTLPSYNTAICVAALAKFSDPRSKDAVRKGAEFLKRLQCGESAVPVEGSSESGVKVDSKHPYYGGWGYGKHGRPDLSNTAFALEALHAAGVEPSDPAFKRAMVFLQRVQMLEKSGDQIVNEMDYAKGSRQGGFIYATSIDKDHVGSGQSQVAATIEETLDDGSKVSRLRAYGSMTYSGFKSYVYAGLAKDDPRVAAALGWIAKNYTLSENPGAGTDGLYYYYVVFSRAMAANGSATIRSQVHDSKPETPQYESRRWASDLINQLATLQDEDGSFRSVDDRWMENNKVLITAYSVIALSEAAR